MRNSVVSVVFVVAVCFTMFCPHDDLYAMKANVGAAVDGNNEFAVDLYSMLMEDEGNIFFSPYSISTALGMVYAGARGKTEAEMVEVLHFGMPREQLHLTFGRIINELNSRQKMKENELAVANALWAQEGYQFLDEYLFITKDSYRAEANELNFRKKPEESRTAINKWVEKKTNDKIKDLIPRGVIDDMTRLVLTNAIYFKGKWQDEFEPEMTKDMPFTLSSSNEADVPMMQRTGRYGYVEEETFRILEMPYAGMELSMVIFLPNEKDGLKDFEKRLTVIKQAGPTMEEDVDNTPLATKLARWMSEARPREVAVSLPRFKTTSSFNLNEALKSMGMTEAFSVAADFSGMTGGKDLYLSAVVHKAYVDVNEEGTEAAAATGAVMKPTSIREQPRPVVFMADHPFIFLIRDNGTGSILFMGRVMDPRE